MYAVISRDQIQLPPGSVLRMPGTWDDYCALRESRGDGSIPRIKFRNGEILLMSPLLRHGREAHRLASVVGILLASRDRNYEAFTPITMDCPEVWLFKKSSLQIYAFVILLVSIKKHLNFLSFLSKLSLKIVQVMIFSSFATGFKSTIGGFEDHCHQVSNASKNS